MDFWHILAIVTWIPAGYIGARYWLASGMAHRIYHEYGPVNRFSCRENANDEELNFSWQRSVTTSDGHIWFVLGVLSGPVTMFLAVLIIGITYLVWWSASVLAFTGRFIAPR